MDSHLSEKKGDGRAKNEALMRKRKKKGLPPSGPYSKKESRSFYCRTISGKWCRLVRRKRRSGRKDNVEERLNGVPPYLTKKEGCLRKQGISSERERRLVGPPPREKFLSSILRGGGNCVNETRGPPLGRKGGGGGRKMTPSFLGGTGKNHSIAPFWKEKKGKKRPTHWVEEGGKKYRKKKPKSERGEVSLFLSPKKEGPILLKGRGEGI